MRVTRKSRLRLRLENLVFYALLLGATGLLAFLSTRYHVQLDWTVSGRNTLSEASQALLGRLEGPVAITAYAREDEVLRGRVRDLVERYRTYRDCGGWMSDAHKDEWLHDYQTYHALVGKNGYIDAIRDCVIAMPTEPPAGADVQPARCVGRPSPEEPRRDG